jgi:hypothetical protein
MLFKECGFLEKNNVIKINTPAFVDASSSNTLPIFVACQELVFWIEEGDGKERKKAR